MARLAFLEDRTWEETGERLNAGAVATTNTGEFGRGADKRLGQASPATPTSERPPSCSRSRPKP